MTTIFLFLKSFTNFITFIFINAIFFPNFVFGCNFLFCIQFSRRFYLFPLFLFFELHIFIHFPNFHTHFYTIFYFSILCVTSIFIRTIANKIICRRINMWHKIFRVFSEKNFFNFLNSGHIVKWRVFYSVCIFQVYVSKLNNSAINFCCKYFFQKHDHIDIPTIRSGFNHRPLIKTVRSYVSYHYLSDVWI